MGIVHTGSDKGAKDLRGLGPQEESLPVAGGSINSHPEPFCREGSI